MDQAVQIIGQVAGVAIFAFVLWKVYSTFNKK